MSTIEQEGILMLPFKKHILECRKRLTDHGLDEARVRYELSLIAKRYVVTILARKAYDRNVPKHDGPVWFGEESWKTDFWVRQWEMQKAYQEGEAAKAIFDGRNNNPYKQEKLPYTTREIELEFCWYKGFDGEKI